MKKLKKILRNFNQRSNKEFKEYPPEFQPAYKPKYAIIAQNTISVFEGLSMLLLCKVCLTFWHRSFTFNSNKSPT
jgi:hypothetical protein